MHNKGIKFEAGGLLNPSELTLHINTNEGTALYKTLLCFLEHAPSALAGSFVNAHLDSAVVVANLLKGGGRSEELTAVCKKIFWLQVRHQFTIHPLWISTTANWESDDITREPAAHDATLHRDIFRAIQARTRLPINIDWMASEGNVQCSEDTGIALPYVSRYYEPNAVATDVLAQSLRHIPGRTDTPALGLCFPPLPMVVPVVRHAVLQGANIVMILPMDKAVWGALIPAERISDTWLLPAHANNGASALTMLTPGGLPVPATGYPRMCALWLSPCLATL